MSANPQPSPGKAVRRTLRLDDLVPHPAQSIYDEGTPDQDARLLADIRERGLDNPIEVFPPVVVDGRTVYPIRDGCRRKQALVSMGHTEAEVIVRYDLPAHTTVAGQIAFLQANRQRRQLDMVQQVRLAVREYELLHAKGRTLRLEELQRAREGIGKIIGKSGRTVSRYLRLARTPLAVQRAVSLGLVPMTVAQKVADLSEEAQQLLADELAGANTPAAARAVLARHVGGPTRHRHQRVNDGVNALGKSLARALADIGDRADGAGAGVVREHVTVFKAARSLLDVLIGRAAKGGRG